MKTNSIVKRKIILPAAVLCLVSLLSSCLKSTSTDYAPPVALVSFFQASPDETALDLYFNNNKVNVGPIKYGTGLDYFRAYAGLRNINFYTYGVMSQVFSDTATIKPNQIYSIFLTNKSNKPELVVLKDTINQPQPNTASVRFVDLSPDAPNVDLVLSNDVTVSNKTYKGFSSFLPVTGNSTYNIQVKQAGTNTVLATLSNVTFNTNRVYTIIFSGLVSGATEADQPAIYYVTNAYY
ncbi:MAG: DUF4397 domain-containing protein [Bacteroidetes bacterium]|nr:DUF4397 domain-containing protein [Bacteroidota bacterium]